MNLTDFKGMSWDEAQAVLTANLPLLCLSDDDETRECAVSIRDQGIDSGVAILCSTLFLKDNGPKRAIHQGIALYREAIADFEKQGKSARWTKDQVNNMDSWVAWMGAPSPISKEIVWSIRFPYRKPDKKAGMGNIMLWLGVMGLEDDGQNTTRIAANAIVEFLKEAVRRKKEQ